MPNPHLDSLPATIPPAVRAALAEAKERLAEAYGDRLDRLVLYGSHARGDARVDSDVDVLIVLREGYDPYAEGKRLSLLRLDLSVRYGVDVAMQPYSSAEVADVARPLMHSVARDGVTL